MVSEWIRGRSRRIARPSGVENISSRRAGRNEVEVVSDKAAIMSARRREED